MEEKKADPGKEEKKADPGKEEKNEPSIICGLTLSVSFEFPKNGQIIDPMNIFMSTG